MSSNQLRMFAYQWVVDENETEITSIRIYGVNDERENVCIRVDDFTPYVYVELPTKIDWDGNLAQLVGNKIDEIMGRNRPVKKAFMMMYKLYGAEIDYDGNRKTYPYLFCSFSTKAEIKTLTYKLRKALYIPGVGSMMFKVHESDADPILQLTCCRNIPTAGWILFSGKEIVDEESKVTLCEHEYLIGYKRLSPGEGDTIPPVLIMSFDLEVNSTNPSAMPNSKKPGDKIFQASCVIGRDGDNPDTFDKFLITLGEPDPKIVGEDVTIIQCETEFELLTEFTNLVRTYNPNIISGYNIMTFDIPYMIDRAKFNLCISDFDLLGFHKYNHANEKVIDWSSSAYKNQKFIFLDAEGRLFIDLLPLVRRDFKMNNYKLKTISEYFIGETKDPLTPKGIFKCYRLGVKRDENGKYTKTGKKAMGIVGKYAIQDSVLVAKLLDKLKTFTALSEMAKVCGTSIFSLYTQGQQLKVYSQIYKYCFQHGIVVEKDAYQCADNERYTGAHVFNPVPGNYNHVVPLDFSSLYPSIMIAYNICPHTWVKDDSNISDEKCEVMEWVEHINCLVKGTLITIGEYSVPIELLEFYRGNILCYDFDKNGLSYSQETNFFNQGKKECIELVFEDGTTLGCTPDHRILTRGNKWIQAKDLILNETEICCGYKPPYFDVGEETMTIGNFVFKGDKLLKFFKILGLLITDGHANSSRTVLYVGHDIDLSNLTKDIQDLSPGCYTSGKSGSCITVSINGDLGKAFRNLEGITWGSKYGKRTFPEILKNVSLACIRAFLSGLFGGDGHTISYNKAYNGFSSVNLAWSSDSEEDLTESFEYLSSLLNKCGFYLITKTRSKKTTILHICNQEVLKFKDEIGFSYCVHKSMRLEAACYYIRLKNEVWNQQKQLITKVKELKNTMTLSEALEKTVKILYETQPIYNTYYTTPTLSRLKDLLRTRRKDTKPMFSYDYFPEPMEYMKKIGAFDFFVSDKKHTYSVDKNQNVLPLLYKRVIFVRNIGIQEVYDLEVKDFHNFVANGVVVHNCEHDPKVIKRMELSQYIQGEEAILKELREKKKKARKHEKDQYTDLINKKVEELKPYKKERSEIVKSLTGKAIMCTKRYYRFLKEPKGVFPSVVQGFLDARASVRKQQGEIKKKIMDLKSKNLDGSLDSQIKELNSLWDIYEKRQLAFKVSANSAYGAMGVRKGYIPFMPGAMCITYKGREGITKVAKVIPEKYGGKLVYGDSVTPDTPVLIRIGGMIDYVHIQDLPMSGYIDYKETKQESLPLSGLEVWSDKGFTPVKRIIRHRTTKKLYRVVTSSGTVDVTEDHGLLDHFSRKVSIIELDVGDRLLTKNLPVIGSFQPESFEGKQYTSKDKLLMAKLCLYAEANGWYPQISLLTDNETFFLEFSRERNIKGCDYIHTIVYLGTTTDYVYDIETENHHFGAGIGELIIHNTDSNYVNFPHCKNSKELWDHAIYVADEVSKLFPRPMKLEFEKVIYAFFLILTKKRYMYRSSDRDGNIDRKIGKKGVLLARRDNSKFVRDVYEYVIGMIADNISKDEILYFIIEQLNLLCSHSKPITDFIVTKSVGNIGNLIPIPFINEKGVKKAKIGDYTVPLLEDDETKREVQMAKKGADSEKDFYLLCLPAQVQLAERMRKRGQIVDPGTRLEYVITDPDRHNAKQYEKVESADYVLKFGNVIKIDYFYYIKALITPLDQVLSVVFPGEQEFLLNQYKYRLNIRRKLIKEIDQLFSPMIISQ